VDKVQRIRDYWAEAVRTGNRSATKPATHRAGPIGLAFAVSAMGLVSAQAVESAAPKAEAPRAEAPPPAPTPPGETKPTTCDAGCVRSSAERASQVCASRIENEAPFDFEWLTRPYGGIFQEADPPAAGGMIVRYKGDSIRFMNPQREWVRITYECSFNAATQRVEGVVVRIGRLNGRGLPPAAGNAGRVAANGPQQGAPPIPAAPPVKRKPRPGEPSSIEILQVTPSGR
jgi:hypothetical protein